MKQKYKAINIKTIKRHILQTARSIVCETLIERKK